MYSSRCVIFIQIVIFWRSICSFHEINQIEMTMHRWRWCNARWRKLCFCIVFVCFKNGWRWIPPRRLKYQIGIKLEIIIWKLNITISRTTCITNENKTKSNKGHFLLCYKTYVYKCNLEVARGLFKMKITCINQLKWSVKKLRPLLSIPFVRQTT